MNKIEMEKTYRTRDGRPVRILCVDRNDEDYPVVGMIGDRSLAVWSAHGTSANRCEDDLVERTKWDDFRIDEPVWAQQSPGGVPYKAHFAGTDNGRPCVWANGQTSWSTEDEGLLFPHEVRKP